MTPWHVPSSMLNRRRFLLGSLGAGSAAVLGCAAATPPSAPAAPPPAPTPAPAPSSPAAKSMLILGGTGFLGPAVVEAAKARGFVITLFNRGKTRPELFPGIEKLRGDRDPSKDEGLKALEGRSWDVVVDNSGYYPRVVRASAELLAPKVKQYIFISSVSVYADSSVMGGDEGTPLATLADPTVEAMGKDFENYGGLKALCEQAAEKAMPGRVANVRPGYIVGPEDRSDRFTYWPVRVARGGEMLVPGTANDPLQIIDVRDLAEWLVMLAASHTTGVFNAVGPGEPLTMGGVLDICKAVTGSAPRFTWVTSQFLKDQPGEPIEMPIWEAPEGKSKGMHTWSAARARQVGLKHRPVIETVKDTLSWFRTLPEERQQKMRAGLSPEREAELLAAWRNPPKKPRAKKG
jgi:2'-hydroxyisoflavone reductase